eukprot:TRINITY_DN1323_c0_g1_i4.p1 TRINITY_DN1323_c0_g1~~TRINITY_DN1323_c0_g1_i4.p1  ORF type:complete len:253 (+),score=44.26 TRINITY_DN1323_c0_g1_i4:74-760(+)
MCIRDRYMGNQLLSYLRGNSIKMQREYDHLFKLVIIGNSGVGKSSLLLRFADDAFSDTYLTTIGVDFRFRTLNIDGKNVKLQIWDTAGQERFRTITNAYYKGADGIVIVYDVTNQSSFDDIEKYWINEVESFGEKDVELILIGNKNDLSSDKIVPTELAEEYAKARKMMFFEASAKTAEHVNLAFLEISKKLMAKKPVHPKSKYDVKPRDGKLTATPQDPVQNKNSCC